MDEDVRIMRRFQLRQFLQYVSAFCGGSPVDVLCYSSGCPFIRKAILGGTCVDTRESIGSTLSATVNNLVSVGGANYGSSQCAAYLASFVKSCNKTNGYLCGNTFYKDINTG